MDSVRHLSPSSPSASFSLLLTHRAVHSSTSECHALAGHPTREASCRCYNSSQEITRNEEKLCKKFQQITTDRGDLFGVCLESHGVSWSLMGSLFIDIAADVHHVERQAQHQGLKRTTQRAMQNLERHGHSVEETCSETLSPKKSGLSFTIHHFSSFLFGHGKEI